MAEALGLSYTIGPMIVGVAEHLREAASAFSRHRMLVSQAANIASTLKIQLLIFRAAKRTLLGCCLGEELAAQMLDNGRHPLWAETNLQLQLRQRLGDSLGATAEAVNLIESYLQTLDKHRLCGDGNFKSGSRSIVKKLKLAYAEHPFQKIVDCLRDVTQDFRILIEQRAAIADRRKPDSKLSETIHKSILNFRTVQAAAKDLYTVLSLACAKQSEYQVYLAIQSAPHNSVPDFCVGIDVENPRRGHNKCPDSPLWLRFRSITPSPPSIDLLDTAKLTSLVDSTKRKNLHEDPLGSNGAKKAKKSVRFESPSPPPMTDEQRDESFPESRNLVNDIWGLIRNSHVLLESETIPCDGSPGYAAESKFVLSLDLREATILSDSKSRSSTFISLANLFARPEKSEKGATLSFFDRVRLARLLATAVLRFHATPWLKYTLCSRDIFLYGVESGVINTISVWDEIYLKTSIRSADCAAFEKSPCLSRSLVRNPDIFALGVILIELAFEAPLHSLQRPTDVALHEDQNIDYYIADRVRWAVSRILGARYADLVRKCIHCDFGRGDDLDAIGLQASFYVEVVQELEDLEAKFRGMGLGN